jgi:hypothetical protein
MFGRVEEKNWGKVHFYTFAFYFLLFTFCCNFVIQNQNWVPLLHFSTSTLPNLHQQWCIFLLITSTFVMNSKVYICVYLIKSIHRAHIYIFLKLLRFQLYVLVARQPVGLVNGGVSPTVNHTPPGSSQNGFLFFAIYTHTLPFGTNHFIFGILFCNTHNKTVINSEMKVKYLVCDVTSANVGDLYVLFQRAFSPVSIMVFEPRRSGNLTYAFIQVATKVIPKEFESMRYIHTQSPAHFHEMRESYAAIPLVEEDVEIIDSRTPVESDPLLAKSEPVVTQPPTLFYARSPSPDHPEGVVLESSAVFIARPPPPPNYPESVAAPVHGEYYIPPCKKCGLNFATGKEALYRQGRLYHRNCFGGELPGNYTQKLYIHTHPLTHTITDNSASDEESPNPSDDEAPPPNKRLRKPPVDTDDKGKCPVCGTRVADKHSYHKHRGTYYHEACYLEDIRRARCKPHRHTHHPAIQMAHEISHAQSPDAPPKSKQTRSSLPTTSEYPQLCEDIPRARRCPICHSYQYGPLGLAQHMSYGCYEQL